MLVDIFVYACTAFGYGIIGYGYRGYIENYD